MKKTFTKAEYPLMSERQAATMSGYEFCHWHAEDTLYIRRLVQEDGRNFAVFAGDGTFLDTAETFGEIIHAAFENGMSVATIH